MTTDGTVWLARRGAAGQGWDWFAMAWRGIAGKAPLAGNGSARNGGERWGSALLAWSGPARHALAQLARPGAAWRGIAGKAGQGPARHGPVWSGTAG